jgi:hypothetical protein
MAVQKSTKETRKDTDGVAHTHKMPSCTIEAILNIRWVPFRVCVAAPAFHHSFLTTSANHFRVHSVPDTHISYARRLQQDKIWIQNYKMLPNSTPYIFCIKITSPAAREPSNPFGYKITKCFQTPPRIYSV